MGILDDLFSSSGGNIFDPAGIFKGPSTEQFTLDTLTPEQQQALNDLIARLSGGEPRRFGGDVRVDQSSLQQTSLAGLENRALELSDPRFQTDIARQEEDTLLKLLDFEQQNLGVNEFFNTSIRDPALESFRETVLPQIGRSFGGSNFFGSERQTADAQARDDLLKHLTRSRSDVTFRADQANRDRALQALGLSTDRGTAQTQELLGIAGAGAEATGLEERNVSREFQQFLAEAGLEDDQVKQLLAALSIPQLENVVVGQEGARGGGEFLGALISLFASSDSQLKKAISLVGRVQVLTQAAVYNVYTWTWNTLAKVLGVTGPTIGVMAQEIPDEFVVVDKNGFLMVDYGRLLRS